MKMMDYVDVLNEEIVEGMDTRFDSHDEHSHSEDSHNHKEHSHSEDSYNQEEGSHSEDSLKHEEHSHNSEVSDHKEESHNETDEHIWTSPVNEIIMTCLLYTSRCV